jgi:hypothetical protein
MPVSDLHGFSDIAIEIQRIAPRSVLDLGVGFGLYGVLCRQIMDGQDGRCDPSTWRGSLEGYEAWANYRNPAWGVYNRIEIEKFNLRRDFDLVLMIDSLEHMPEKQGRFLLRWIVGCNKHVIVSVPNGLMVQGATFGNPYEEHRWTFNGTEEFEPYNFKLIHQSVCTVVSIEGMK